MATLNSILDQFAPGEFAELKATIAALAANEKVTRHQALLYARWVKLGGPEALDQAHRATSEALGMSDAILDQFGDDELDLLYDAFVAIRDEHPMTEAQQAVYIRWSQAQSIG